MVVVVLLAKFRGQLFSASFSDTSLASRVARVVPYAFPFLVFVNLFSKVFTGRHVVDFAIFAQSIDNISRLGYPQTTLVGLEPINFLTHHFCPILYAIGIPGYLGIPGYMFGILAQTGSLALALYSIFSIAIYKGLSRTHASYVTAMFCIHPSIRKAVTMSMHDEVFALGVLGMAILFWTRRQGWYAASMLFVAMLCKETVALCVIALAMAAIADCLLTRSKRTCAPYIVVALITTSVLIAYSQLRISDLGSTFDTLARISTLQQLVHIPTALEKLKYLCFLVVPTLGLCFSSVRGSILVICAAPFWGASLISSFPAMWEPTYYYAALPVFFIHIGFVFALAEKRFRTQRTPLMLVSLLVPLCFVVGGNIRPFRELSMAISESVATPYSLSFSLVDQRVTTDTNSKKAPNSDSVFLLKPGQRVIASEQDVLFLPREVTPLRLWTANRIPTHYDSILIRKSPNEQAEPVGERLLRETNPCYEDERWILRCRKAG